LILPIFRQKKYLPPHNGSNKLRSIKFILYIEGEIRRRRVLTRVGFLHEGDW
jgi:hypothetical protein